MQVDVGIGIDIPLETIGTVDFDINLHNLMFYALTITILIENLYQLIKPFFRKKIKVKDITEEISNDVNNYENNNYNHSSAPIIVEKELDYKHAIIPPLIGIILACSFYPITYFSFMPFQPAWKFLEIIFTAIIFGRIANAGHSASTRIQELSLSLIGRIIGVKKW